MMQWVLAATLFCGAGVFTSCSSDHDNPGPEQANKNRTEFINHTRQNLKELAENLNFGSWMNANRLNTDFNSKVLNNKDFEKVVLALFTVQAIQSIKPVEEGSELAQMGYQTYATVDFTKFNYRFTMNEEGTGFDVEEAEDFELLFKRSRPERRPLIDGEERPERPERPEGSEPGDRYAQLILKASGDCVEMIEERMSKDGLAVILRIPEVFEYSIRTLVADETDDDEEPAFSGTFRNDFVSSGTSSYINLRTDAWNISGVLNTDIQPRAPKDGEAPKEGEGPRRGPKADATNLAFAIGQDPTTHEASIMLNFTHNDKSMVMLSGILENLNGLTDYTEFTNGMSIADAFTKIMAGNNMKSATLTLLDDLSIQTQVTDCEKVLILQQAMARARRNYADQQTIDGYTQQLNELVSSRMTCSGVNQVIPIQMQTIKFGVDYWAVPALNFADEKGYVPITEMLDTESIQYMINIVDHAAEPMQESLVVVRQLMQYIQTIAGTFKNAQETQVQGNPL